MVDANSFVENFVSTQQQKLTILFDDTSLQIGLPLMNHCFSRRRRIILRACVISILYVTIGGYIYFYKPDFCAPIKCAQLIDADVAVQQRSLITIIHLLNIRYLAMENYFNLT